MPLLKDLLLPVILKASQGERMTPTEESQLRTILMGLEATWADVSTFLTSDLSQIFNIPTGGKFVGIFKTASIPSGWTRVAAWDDKFIRGAETYGGTGGAADHIHTYTALIRHRHGKGNISVSNESGHTHSYNYRSSTQVVQLGADHSMWVTTTGANSGTGSAHDHDLSGDTDYEGSAGAQDTSRVSSLPPYIDVVFASKD